MRLRSIRSWDNSLLEGNDVVGSTSANDVSAEIAENLRFRLLEVVNEKTVTHPYGKPRLLEIAVAQEAIGRL